MVEDIEEVATISRDEKYITEERFQTVIERPQEVDFKTGEEFELITEEELEEADFGYDSELLTYYRLDAVLCHVDGQVIYQMNDVIGVQNYRNLANVPLDQSQTFIRNHRTRKEYIIDMDPNHYASTYPEHEIKHSRTHRKTPRFRVDDG